MTCEGTRQVAAVALNRQSRWIIFCQAVEGTGPYPGSITLRYNQAPRYFPKYSYLSLRGAERRNNPASWIATPAFGRLAMTRKLMKYPGYPQSRMILNC